MFEDERPHPEQFKELCGHERSIDLSDSVRSEDDVSVRVRLGAQDCAGDASQTRKRVTSGKIHGHASLEQTRPGANFATQDLASAARVRDRTISTVTLAMVSTNGTRNL